jgi:hypothetical protein
MEYGLAVNIVLAAAVLNDNSAIYCFERVSGMRKVKAAGKIIKVCAMEYKAVGPGEVKVELTPAQVEFLNQAGSTIEIKPGEIEVKCSKCVIDGGARVFVGGTDRKFTKTLDVRSKLMKLKHLLAL